jgi:hypothetical protein
MSVMKPRAPTSAPDSAGPDPKLKLGLPGTPDERRREIRALIKRHAETLRRLAR